MNTLHVKKGDLVEVISGAEKGKRGEIATVKPEDGLVIIRGVNIKTKHKKARKQTETSQIVKVEGAIRACKVMRVCPKCDKASRFGTIVAPDGSKKTVCKRCHAEI